MNSQININELLVSKSDYFAGLMFSPNNPFKHHYKATGKPSTFLLNEKDERVAIDANLFYPLRDGMIVVEYKLGKMTSYCQLRADKKGNITGVPRKPYGTLKNIRNNFQCPNNIFEQALKIFMEKGFVTWSHWKALINVVALDWNDSYIFPTLTAKQDRIPNVGMIIYEDVKKEADNLKINKKINN